MKLRRIVRFPALLGALILTGLNGAVAQTGITDRPSETAPNTNSTSRPSRDIPPPRVLLRNAIRAIDAAQTISASTLMRGSAFDRSLVGSGAYWERKGSHGVEYRWEMKFQAGDTTVCFVQVCNGRYLWLSRTVGKRESIDRIDVDRVLEALGNDPKTLPPTSKCGSWLLLGGLGKMLASLDYSFEFEPAEQIRLDREIAVFRLEGSWKPAVLQSLLPEPKRVIDAGRIVRPEKMPPHLPTTVSICLEKSVLIPRRIEYVRRQGSQGSQSSHGSRGGQGDQGSPSSQGGQPGEASRGIDEKAAQYITVAAIDFTDVSVDRPIPDSVDFKPEAGPQAFDRTDQFLLNLGLKRGSRGDNEQKPPSETIKPLPENLER